MFFSRPARNYLSLPARLLLLQAVAGVSSAAPEDTGGFAWGTADRRSALVGYHGHYMPSVGGGARIAWTGNLANKQPGTVSAVFLNDTLRRMNYYRAQCGLPADVVLTAAKNEKSQWAAAIMTRQNDLSHYPEEDWPTNSILVQDKALHTTSWGHEAAGRANLSLSVMGPEAIDALMVDEGDFNDAAGHRRWHLYPQLAQAGVGAIPFHNGYESSTAVWLLTDFKSAAAAPAKVVTWPNAGWIPWPLIPRAANGFLHARWSCGYRLANFSTATVAMHAVNGNTLTAIPVTKEAYQTGYGDNTLVWKLNNPAVIPEFAPGDTTWRVTIDGITLISGGPPAGFTASTIAGKYKYIYDVTGFDPAELGETITASTPATAFAGTPSTCTSSTVAQSSACRLRCGRPVSGAWLQGAEDATVSEVSEQMITGYPLRSSGLAATGTRSFHLTFQSLSTIDQYFDVTRLAIPAATSRLQFKTRLRFMTTDTRLTAEMSADDGGTWQEVFRRTGDAASASGRSSSWETTWKLADVAVPAKFQNRPVRLRFRLTMPIVGSGFFGVTDSYGAFIDDITITDSQTLTEAQTMPPVTSGNSHTWTPPSAGTWAVQVQPQLGSYSWMNWSALTTVNVSAPAGVDAWRIAHFGTAAENAQNADAADPDRDGMPNLIEYASGGNPQGAATAPQPQRSGNALRLDYTQDTSRTGVTFRAEATTNFQTWYTAGQSGAPAGFTDATNGTAAGSAQPRRAQVTITPGQKVWLRLRATRTP